MQNNLIRSWLFLPINEERFIVKIKNLNADIFVLDLEDAIYKSQKDSSRETLERLKEFKLDPKKIAVRINHLSTQWGRKDLAKCLKNKVKTIVYPKVNSKIDIVELQTLINDIGSDSDSENVKIVPIIETIDGLENISQILEACPNTQYVIFGSEDFLADCGAPYRGFVHENPILIQASTKLSMTCSKYERSFIDCASPFFYSTSDIDSFRAECEFALRLGAKGKLAIHPKQVLHINEIFSGNLHTNIEVFLKKTSDLAEKMHHEQKSVINFENRLVGIPEIRKYIKQINLLMSHSLENKKDLIKLRLKLKRILPDD